MSEKISIAISLIKRYLNDRFENKDKKIINAEVEDNVFKVLENEKVKGTVISRGN